MEQRALNKFYSNGMFLKPYFIRLIRNMIIDPNTRHLLEDGFRWVDPSNGVETVIPCDDANWAEYTTFERGFDSRSIGIPIYHENEELLFYYH